MGKNTVVEFRGREESADPLTDLLRAGARQLIHQAVEAELEELLAHHSERRIAYDKSGAMRVWIKTDRCMSWRMVSTAA